MLRTVGCGGLPCTACEVYGTLDAERSRAVCVLAMTNDPLHLRSLTPTSSHSLLSCALVPPSLQYLPFLRLW